jgi:serine protease Do
MNFRSLLTIFFISSIVINVNGAEKSAVKNEDIPSIVEKILPTVVTINVVKESNDTDYDIYNKTSGTGFIMSPDGYIITNNHIIEEAQEIFVNFQDSDEKLIAKIIGTDEVMDIALLKVNSKRNLSSVEFEELNNQNIGDRIIIAGNPYNLGLSISTGIISALKRDIKINSFDSFIQVDASINKGSSGGPIFNDKGKVIGLTSVAYYLNEKSVGIGFAIPTNSFLPIVNELKMYGNVKRGWIGIETKDVKRDVLDTLNIPNKNGIIVSSIKKNSPAEKAGILISDIIVSYGKNKIKNSKDFFDLLSSTEINSSITIGIYRNGKTLNLKVNVTENKINIEHEMNYDVIFTKSIDIFDMTLVPVVKELREEVKIPDNVNAGMFVLKVKKGGLAEKMDIKAGDIILSINQDLAINRDVILKNIHRAKSNKLENVLLITNRARNNLILMPIKEAN